MTGLIILDGIAERQSEEFNAVKQANTPFIDSLKKKYSNTLLKASEEDVGLLKGQMGNSEVGHITMGAGQIVRQDLTIITEAIKDGSFYENPNLVNFLQSAKQNNKPVHLFGLVSDGGVHSHISHLFALIELCKQQSITDVFVHVITDGRDTSPNSALNFVQSLEQKMTELNVGKIATICGRFYAMDRELKYDRTQKAYNAWVKAEGEHFESVESAINSSYKSGITDEFITPKIICEKNTITLHGKAKGTPIATINNGDYLICFNFRSDRPRQIINSLCGENFTAFKTKNLNLNLLTFTQYDKTYTYPICFEREKAELTLGKILSQNNKTQLRLAEQTKYAHVTFFFNGGRETEFVGETRYMLPGKNVETFDLAPEMSAMEIAQKFVEETNKKQFDFVIINLANGDMVGHTGNFKATVKAVEAVDKALEVIVNQIIKLDGECLVTADHGNADDMRPKSGYKTTHTLNPVMCVLVSETKKPKLKFGGLSNIAPTILKLMGLQIPPNMKGPLF